MSAHSTNINANLLADFHAALRRWYAENGRRGLPWRNTRDPYAIWISEVMLQQTQVSTVLARYYFPFLERFPNVEALAAAESEAVLKAWQGLGYYTRAANLHRAARAVTEARGARQEAGVNEENHSLCAHPHSCLLPVHSCLRSLPGIGQNTAHAVACFGFGAAVPVMEANVKRVLHRIFALRSSSEAVAHKTLWALAETLLDRENAFDYNQAMMDLGAGVCTPRAPKCGECPASLICAGKTSPESYPGKRAKKALPVRQMDIIVQRNKAGKYHAEPRTERFLQGMYRFVEVEQSSLRAAKPRSNPALSPDEPQAGLLRYARNDGKYLGHVSHAYSHFALEAEVWLVESTEGETTNYFTLEELARLPHSRTEAKIIALLENKTPSSPPQRSAGRG